MDSKNDKVPLFSIIIPVYNAAKTIENCITSIINTHEQNIEIIAINDGSTDNSLDLLYNLKKHTNCIFKIYTQINQGPSSARNLGLQNATGEYICFLDADDSLLPDYFIIIRKRIEIYSEKHNKNKPDIIFFPIQNYFFSEIIQSYQTTNFKDILHTLITYDFFGYTSCKVVANQLITKYCIHFNVNIKVCEDLIFTCDLLTQTQNIAIEPTCLYYYRISNYSLSQTLKENLRNDLEYANQYFFSFLERFLPPGYQNMIIEKSVNTIIRYLKQIKIKDRNQQNKDLQWLMQTYSYQKAKEYFSYFLPVIKGKKKWILFIALKFDSIRILKIALLFL